MPGSPRSSRTTSGISRAMASRAGGPAGTSVISCPQTDRRAPIIWRLSGSSSTTRMCKGSGSCRREDASASIVPASYTDSRRAETLLAALYTSGVTLRPREIRGIVSRVSRLIQRTSMAIRRLATAMPLLVLAALASAAVPFAAAETSSGVTLEKIMSDPDWIGTPPENPYWADDGRAVYFERKRTGSDVRDLYRLD